MTQLIPSFRDDRLAQIAGLAVDAVSSDNSKRAYGDALYGFLRWYEAAGRPLLTKALVQSYIAELVGSGLAPSTVNQRLSAVRKLAAEAADNGLIAPEIAAGIARIRGVPQAGVRTGNWLSGEQAVKLLNAPDRDTLKGLRDRALLALLIGTGLRRDEACRLEFEHVQQREGRWVAADLVGKGHRVRTVPVPSWAKASLDTWAAAAGLDSGRVFRAINRGGHISNGSLSPQAVYNLARGYAAGLGLEIAPHDLRRTFAKLAHKGHAALEQIQISLGHASILTTERYLGVRQDFSDAPCDRLGLSVGE